MQLYIVQSLCITQPIEAIVFNVKEAMIDADLWKLRITYTV